MKNRLLLLLIICGLILLPAIFFAQPAQAHNAVVRAVLFYSPTCGHCEKVINEVLPPLSEKWGEHLSIAMVDVTQPDGQALYQLAIQQFEVSDDRLGVPTLIVGSNYLVGDLEIPQQFPGIIETGIAGEGIEWPPIDGLDKWTADLPSVQAQAEPGPWDRLLAKFNRDRAGNTLAVLTLVIMLASVVGVAISYARGASENERPWPLWVVPALSIIGLFVSFYLTFVEVTKTQALCGPVGDCNTVQQSPYATLFGILPVGILGLLGYLAILAVWWVGRQARSRRDERLQKTSHLALWGLAWFGILFSIYLTFLEPFVIGATCIWCISQALVMTLMLWATTGPAKQALELEEDDFEDEEVTAS